MSTTVDPAAQRRGRLVLLGLALLFMGPLAASWIWYFSGSSPAETRGTTNRGELISPARPLAQVAFPSLDGPAPDSFPRGVWTLMLIDGSGCQTACQETLINLRQVNLALGNDVDRLRHALLVTGTAPDVAALRTQHRDLFLLDATGGAGPLFFKPFPTDANGAVDGSRVYLSDPLGNLMMSYPMDGDPKNMLKDIEKLLRLSRIG
ncbi:MAG: hypothetical protein AAFN78_06555 [Pseudomonadota bacterium]